MVRFKNRWLLVEFIPVPSPPISTPHHVQHSASTPYPEELSSKDVFNALKQSVLLHFGDVGWGEVGASLAVKYFSPMTNICIVRVARGTAANTTWAALVLIDRVGASGGGQGRKVVPHVIHVSGTLKHAQIAAVEWNREAIARVKAGVGVYASQPGETVLARLETSIQEIEGMQD